jgi:serine/threonine protein kinase
LGLEPSELLTSTSTAEIDVAPKVPPQPQLDGDLTVRDLQRVGQLQILRHLGSGAFGDVYAAYDATLQRSCAVKVLRGAVSPQLRARFRREAKAAMQLRHENLVAVYDYGEAEATPYLVMELVDGWTLKELLRQVGTLDPPRAARLIHQLARGLVAVHASGAVHRDVKPANILVYRSGPDERIVDGFRPGSHHARGTPLTGAEALGRRRTWPRSKRDLRNRSAPPLTSSALA